MGRTVRGVVHPFHPRRVRLLATQTFHRFAEQNEKLEFTSRGFDTHDVGRSVARGGIVRSRSRFHGDDVVLLSVQAAVAFVVVVVVVVIVVIVVVVVVVVVVAVDIVVVVVVVARAAVCASVRVCLKPVYKCES